MRQAAPAPCSASPIQIGSRPTACDTAVGHSHFSRHPTSIFGPSPVRSSALFGRSAGHRVVGCCTHQGRLHDATVGGERTDTIWSEIVRSSPHPQTQQSPDGFWSIGALIWIGCMERYGQDFARFGDDLLSHVLRRSTIGAKALNGRVRNGTGCFALAMITKPSKILTSKSRTHCVYASGQPALLLLDQIKPIGQLVPVN